MARRINFPGIADAALSSLQELVSEWLPDGRVQGHDYWCCNPSRNDRNPNSFSVDLRTGGYYDHATKDHGKDAIALYALTFSVDQKTAASELARRLGVPLYLAESAQPATRQTPVEQHASWAQPHEDDVRVQVFPADPAAGNPSLVWWNTTPTKWWLWKNADGRPLGVSARYDRVDEKTKQPRKDMVVWTTWRNKANGLFSWQPDHGFPDPLPLLSQENFTEAKKTGRLVVVGEGEKTADAIRTLWPDALSTTWPGGAGKAGRGNWSTLAGCHVALWEDSDRPKGDGKRPGREAMLAAHAALVAAGAASIHWVNTDLIARAIGVEHCEDAKDGYDAADLDASPEWFADLIELDEFFLDSPPGVAPVQNTDNGDAPAPQALSHSATSSPAKPGAPDSSPILDPNQPLQWARRIVDDRFTDDTTQMVALRRHQGQWWLWDGTVYRVASDEAIRSHAYRYLDTCRVEAPGNMGGFLPFGPSMTKVTVCLDAIRTLVALPDELSAPCWITPDGKADGSKPDPTSVIAFSNGLISVGRDGRCEPIRSHTPGWFSTSVLPYAYDPKATCPQWEAFVGGCASKSNGTKDPTWVRSLAQWFGYCLTADNSLQKMALFRGVPRSGKGTMARVLRDLLGADNVATPKVTQLVSGFGLAPLVGKLAAIMYDVRMGRSTDPVAVVEQLLSITGEDPQMVDRKYLPVISAVIRARIVFVGNDTPNLPDASGAFASRLVVFPFHISHLGREDSSLQAKLSAELPGIANWALRGLQDMRAMGKILEAESGLAEKAEVARIASPIKEWVGDRCEMHDEFSEGIKEAYADWCAWCEEAGREPGSRETFGIKVRAAVDGVERYRTRTGGLFEWRYKGFRLVPKIVNVARDVT